MRDPSPKDTHTLCCPRTRTPDKTQKAAGWGLPAPQRCERPPANGGAAAPRPAAPPHLSPAVPQPLLGAGEAGFRVDPRLHVPHSRGRRQLEGPAAQAVMEDGHPGQPAGTRQTPAEERYAAPSPGSHPPPARPPPRAPRRPGTGAGARESTGMGRQPSPGRERAAGPTSGAAPAAQRRTPAASPPAPPRRHLHARRRTQRTANGCCRRRSPRGEGVGLRTAADGRGSP